MERFGYVVQAACFECLHFVEHLVECADKYDGDVLKIRVGFQLPADLVTIHLRHIDVEQYEIGRSKSSCGQHEFASSRDSDSVVLLSQHFQQEIETSGQIV